MSASSHCTPWNSAIGLAELAPLPGIVERRLEPGLGDADGERGDADPALVEHAHHHVEAAAFLAQQRLRGQLDVVEVQRADRRGALAHLVLLGPRATPGRSRSTMKMLMPRWPASLSVRASTKAKSQTGALWIQSLPPSSRQPSPVRVAVVRMPETSEPASASVMP